MLLDYPSHRQHTFILVEAEISVTYGFGVYNTAIMILNALRTYIGEHWYNKIMVDCLDGYIAKNKMKS